MARGNKEVKVEVRETERNTEDFVELELFINDEKIGTVQQEGKKKSNCVYERWQEFCC
ncbi:conserved hypothetical protein [Carnobacterium maltaromaticum]|nr:conserved hypothetical protein [Carnobacterium maltaromaticum]